MAIEKLHQTLEPPNPQSALRYVQFDAIRINVDKELFDGGLMRLAGAAVHPGSTVSQSDIEELFQSTVLSPTGRRYDVVITNAQYSKVVAYLANGAYFYKDQGSPLEASYVLAFSYGERGSVNSQIRYLIETTLAGNSKAPAVYAQWEIVDIQTFHATSGLTFHRIGMDPGKDYIYSHEVVQKFLALSGAQPGSKVFLACQAWHGPRCWRICEKAGLEVVGGIFVNLFSPNDPQPWVRDAMSWVIKEGQK